jgi:hypothetical protein
VQALGPSPHGREDKIVKVLGKSEGKRPVERPKRRWEEGSEFMLGRLVGVWSKFSWLRIGKGGGLL